MSVYQNDKDSSNSIISETEKISEEDKDTTEQEVNSNVDKVSTEVEMVPCNTGKTDTLEGDKVSAEEGAEVNDIEIKVKSDEEDLSKVDDDSDEDDDDEEDDEDEGLSRKERKAKARRLRKERIRNTPSTFNPKEEARKIQEKIRKQSEKEEAKAGSESKALKEEPLAKDNPFKAAILKRLAENESSTPRPSRRERKAKRQEESSRKQRREEQAKKLKMLREKRPNTRMVHSSGGKEMLLSEQLGSMELHPKRPVYVMSTRAQFDSLVYKRFKKQYNFETTLELWNELNAEGIKTTLLKEDKKRRKQLMFEGKTKGEKRKLKAELKKQKEEKRLAKYARKEAKRLEKREMKEREDDLRKFLRVCNIVEKEIQETEELERRKEKLNPKLQKAIKKRMKLLKKEKGYLFVNDFMDINLRETAKQEIKAENYDKYDILFEDPNYEYDGDDEEELSDIAKEMRTGELLLAQMPNMLLPEDAFPSKASLRQFKKGRNSRNVDILMREDARQLREYQYGFDPDDLPEKLNLRDEYREPGLLETIDNIIRMHISPNEYISNGDEIQERTSQIVERVTIEFRCVMDRMLKINKELDDEEEKKRNIQETGAKMNAIRDVARLLTYEFILRRHNNREKYANFYQLLGLILRPNVGYRVIRALNLSYKSIRDLRKITLQDFNKVLHDVAEYHAELAQCEEDRINGHSEDECRELAEDRQKLKNVYEENDVSIDPKDNQIWVASGGPQLTNDDPLLRGVII